MPSGVRGEYVMALNRIGFGTLMLALAKLFGGALPLAAWASSIEAWLACSFALLGLLSTGTRHASMRRCLAILLDVAGTTILLIAGGQQTAFLWVVYQWIIIGNGFRFGGHYTLAGSVLSIVGFGLVIESDPFWREHRSLSAGLLAGLVVLPAYSFVLIRQLSKARQLAERAAEAKSLFLASVSHELRTPLNAIIGMAELLQATPLDPAQAEMVGTINAAADGQLSLIQDVLTFTSLEVEQARLNVAPFDLVTLVGGVRAIIAPGARKKGLLLNVFITSRTPQQLEGDERRIREVLLNVMSNAVKFTSRGSVTLSVDGVPAPNGRIRLSFEVMDTGIGIKAEAQAKIFNLFTQADETVLDRFGGTGLGLALCDRQVRLMNGAIGVHSELGAGSTFWIDLELTPAASAATPALPPVRLVQVAGDGPGSAADLTPRLAAFACDAADAPAVAVVPPGSEGLVPPGVGALIELVETAAPGLPPRPIRERFVTSVARDAGAAEWQRAVRIATAACSRSAKPAAADPAGAPGAADAGRLRGRTVLIADDNGINRTILAQMLDGFGVRPVFAADGEEALAILTEGAVDAALLDVNMPVMNGVETAKLYAFATLGRRAVPLIGLTADATPATRDRCLAAGMARCLAKPVRTAELVEALLGVVSAAPDNPAPRPTPPPPAATLHRATLTALQDLGGAEFVARLIDDFVRDGEALLDEVEVACTVPDVGLFRATAHSLASIAANMGASAIAERCGRWQHMAEAEFMDRRGDLVGQIRRAWRDTRTALAERHEHRPTERSRSIG